MIDSVVTMALPTLPALVYEVLWERLGLGPMPFPLVMNRHGRDETRNDESAGPKHTDN